MLENIVKIGNILHLELSSCNEIPEVQLSSLEDLARFLSKTNNNVVFTGNQAPGNENMWMNRFMVFHEGVMYWADSYYYRSFSDFDAGMKTNFKNGKDFYAAKEGGFNNFEEFDNARKKGYKTTEEVESAKSKGFAGCFEKFIDLEYQNFSFDDFDEADLDEGEIEWIGGIQ